MPTTEREVNMGGGGEPAAVRKSELWKVPVFCFGAGIIAFQLNIRLFLRFALVSLPDGTITSDNDKALLIYGVVFAVSVLAGCFCFRNMSRRERFLSAGILVVLNLISVFIQWCMGGVSGALGVAFLYLSILSEWSQGVSSLIFKLTGNPWLGAVAQAFAPLVFALPEKKKIPDAPA